MFFPNPKIQKFMKTRESEGFFCVVYFVLEEEQRKDKNGNLRKVITKGKTGYYHKVYTPKKLANYLKNWHWIKGYINKQDYFANPENYHFIFNADNPPTDFNYRTFSRN